MCILSHLHISIDKSLFWMFTLIWDQIENAVINCLEILSIILQCLYFVASKTEFLSNNNFCRMCISYLTFCFGKMLSSNCVCYSDSIAIVSIFNLYLCENIEKKNIEFYETLRAWNRKLCMLSVASSFHYIRSSRYALRICTNPSNLVLLFSRCIDAMKKK